ncbi:MAG TPA: anti-sigma factor, partial [Terriglobales bacterium]|nr:anti-sigma factor [Terriglobales bacterium]
QAYENIRALSSALKSSDLYFKAPALLKRRIRESLGAENKDAPTLQRSNAPTLFWWQWLKWGIPIAGTALIAFALTTSFIRASTDERLAQEVTANHVRSLMATHLTDVTSSDQHTVKPWFDGKIDFAPPVKDLAAQGFPLIGGRLDYLQNRPVAALVYQRHKHFVNLFIWPATRSSSTTKKAAVRQGYNLVHWNDSGMTFWAVSDLNPVELREFAELIK